MRAAAVCALLFLVAACEPAVTAPVKVMAIVANNKGTYDTRQVELTTPDSVIHMTGSLLTLIGGAQVELNPDDPGLQTITSDDQLLDVLMKNKGGSVRANFVDKSGVLWPSDFHSWAMATTFYNFEQAFAYYQKAYNGKPTTELKGIRVLYWAGYKDLTTGEFAEMRDNAIFFSPVRAFMILPFEKLQKVPLSLNIGVVGHEFSHLVFSKRVFGGVSLPQPLTSWTLTPFNLLKAMDEGFADFHGYGVTCATGTSGPGCLPSFISASFDVKDPVNGAEYAKLIAARNIADDTHCMTQGLRAAIHNYQPGQFLREALHYELGTLIATSLYQASAPLGKEDVMQKALIDSLDDESAANQGFRQLLKLYLNTPQSFTPELMANTIAAHIADLDLRKQVCKQLWTRLDLDSSIFPSATLSACATATRGTFCPVFAQ